MVVRGECGTDELAAEARAIFEMIHGDEEGDGVQWAAHCKSDRIGTRMLCVWTGMRSARRQ
eukprot:1150326-Prymnesium_polylepis.1